MTASAQLQDCPAGGGSDLKVFLDAFYVQDPTLINDAELSSLHLRLVSSLRTRLVTLNVEDLAVRLVSCKNRRPDDGSEFDSNRAGDLNARGVIMEIWGVLEAKKTAGNITDRAGVVHYVIHPLRYYGFFSEDKVDVPGLYESRFPRLPVGQDAGFLELISQSTELSAYAAIGIGLKKARAGDANGAVAYLTRGEHELSSGAPVEPSETASRAALLRYVHLARCAALKLTTSADVFSSAGPLPPAGVVGDCK